MLGKSPAWQDAGGASCSGYLVEDEGARVLLDCGSGVLGKLRAVVDYADVDAVVVSTFTPTASSTSSRTRRRSSTRRAISRCRSTAGRTGGSSSPAAARAAEPVMPFRRLCTATGMREQHIETAFTLEEYDPSCRCGWDRSTLRSSRCRTSCPPKQSSSRPVVAA